MKIFKLKTISKFDEKNLNLTIGNFDGIHLGHQSVIKQLINISKKNNYKSAILSFNPHPREFFSKSKDPFNIITPSFKKYLFSKILKKKDIIMLVHGGHGFKVLKDIEMLEIKQGPYSLIKDKIKFENINENKIKIKK